MKKICSKCNNEFTTKGGNYKRHYDACDGSYVRWVKLNNCKHCGIDFSHLNTSERANHSRWCDKNPKREQYNKETARMRNGITEESRLKQREAIKQAHADGKYKDAAKKSIKTRRQKGNLCHNDETKELIRQKALASKHRRLVRSVREYVKKDGTIVMLDSSWEEALAKRLDDTGVEWIRPKEPIPYIASDGKQHNYFPDFYLPEHDLYLDPKNPAAMNAQKDKLDSLKKTIYNLVLIESLDGCVNFSIYEVNLK